MRRRMKVSNARLAKLYFSEGLSIPEIAEKCHIGQRTLYSRAHRLGFKLRSRQEAGQMRQRKNLERERDKLRNVLLRWNISPDDCLYTDAEIDAVMDRIDEIGQELKSPVRPKVTQDCHAVKEDALTPIH